MANMSIQPGLPRAGDSPLLVSPCHFNNSANLTRGKAVSRGERNSEYLYDIVGGIMCVVNYLKPPSYLIYSFPTISEYSYYLGSLVPQTPIRKEKGSGNIAYSKLCQWNSIIITYVTGTVTYLHGTLCA